MHDWKELLTIWQRLLATESQVSDLRRDVRGNTDRIAKLEGRGPQQQPSSSRTLTVKEAAMVAGICYLVGTMVAAKDPAAAVELPLAVLRKFLGVA